jgi:hypothetical protein
MANAHDELAADTHSAQEDTLLPRQSLLKGCAVRYFEGSAINLQQTA